MQLAACKSGVIVRLQTDPNKGPCVPLSGHSLRQNRAGIAAKDIFATNRLGV